MPLCRCGLAYEVCTSGGISNPENRGRQYFRCVNGDAGCGGFVAWVDDERSGDWRQADLTVQLGNFAMIKMCSPQTPGLCREQIKCPACDKTMIQCRAGACLTCVNAVSTKKRKEIGCGPGCQQKRSIFFDDATTRAIAEAEIGRELTDEEASWVGTSDDKKLQEVCLRAMVDDVIFFD